MNISFTEYKGVVILVRESGYSQVYEFNGVEYQRFYEVTYAVDIWLEENQ
jgi:hypothetical protein